MKTLFVALLVALITSACGWHLRGSVAGQDKLSLTKPISLLISTKDDHSPLINSLRQALPSYNITEVSELKSADYHLDIGLESLDKRTAGVGSDALTSAYEIILEVSYSITRDGKRLTAFDTKAGLTRTYNYNVNNANGAAQEEALIMREMRRELAQQLLRRLKALSSKTATSATDTKANSNAQTTP
jgi:LPS-assembly lipoprotein